MKKLVTIAALLMATTSAHAGGVTFQINGERIHIEAPRNCDALSCIKITAPGFSGSLGNIDLKGLGSKKSDDDDVADTTPAKPTPAPVGDRTSASAATAGARCDQCRAGPRPGGDGCDRCTCAGRCCTIRAGARCRRSRAAAGSGPCCCRPGRGTHHAARHLGHRREQGQRSRRAMRRQSLWLFGQEQRKDPDQHEAGRREVDRPHPRSRQRSQLQLDDCDERTECHARSGLRLRRHVLRRSDLETRQLTISLGCNARRSCGSPQGLLHAHSQVAPV